AQSFLPTTILAHCDAVRGGRQPPHLTKTVLPTVAAAIHISNGIYLRNNSKGCLGCGCSVAGQGIYHEKIM
ncbi:hypothetical protein, partial [Acetobacter senegalensis]